MVNVKKLENNVKNTEKKISILDAIFSAIILTIAFFITIICPLMIH